MGKKVGYNDMIRILLARKMSTHPISLGPNETVINSPSFFKDNITLKPLSSKDVQLLGDLRNKIIKYRPEERITTRYRRSLAA